MKQCSKCKKLKPKEDFNKRGKAFQPYCRVCQKETHFLHKQKNKDKLNTYQKQYYRQDNNNIKLTTYQKKYYKTYKNYYLKRKYGIGLHEYNQMIEKQSNLCAICGRPEKAKQGNILKMLAVDHDHKTGNIRELLYSECNLFVGRMENNTERELKMY